MTFASEAAVAALHGAMPRLQWIARMYAKRGTYLDADDLVQVAAIAFCQHFDRCEDGYDPAGYGRYKAEWEVKSAVRQERRWWHRKRKLMDWAPGWATEIVRPKMDLLLDMAATDDWEPFMGWPPEEVADWSDWQQTALRLFQRGW